MKYSDIVARLEESRRILGSLIAEVVEETNRSLPHRTGSLMLRTIRCGRAGCPSCPHGPYWYRMLRNHNGKWRSQYVGPEPTEADIQGADVSRRVVRQATRKIARLRKKRAAITSTLQKVYRKLVAAERAALRD